MQTSNRETAAERQQSLQDALWEVQSIERRCEKVQGKFPPESSQGSLLKNRLRAIRVAERLLEAASPERGALVVLYRALQTMWRSHRGKTGESAFLASDLDIASMCRAIDAREVVDERAVASGIKIFEELGFARVTGFDDGRRIEMSENPGHMALTSSVRYLEGLRARLAFTTFRSWALDASARDMLSRIAHPITPAN